MVKDLVDDLARMTEPSSAVASVMDIRLEESIMMGEANMICEQLDNNHYLKETIKRKLEQEERDIKLLLEYQMKEERKERQRLATMAWREARVS